MKTKVALCKCTGCDQVLIKGFEPGARLYKVETGRYNKLTYDGQTSNCPKCNTDHYLTDEVMEEIISASLCLYYSTTDEAHYVRIITSNVEQSLVFRVSKARAVEISMNNLVEIVETDKSFK
jgi:hypothetical protein